MNPITLRPAELDRDFGLIAALFDLVQDEPTSVPDLREDYEIHKERIFRLMVAEDARGELLGFNWATRSRFDDGQAYFYVIVKPERRGCGAGGRLYADVEEAAKAAQIRQLEISIRDDFPQGKAFAERFGFSERSHIIGMTLDLASFDDSPYAAQAAQLEAEGFQFTSMEVLGNTEAAQRRLFALNDTNVLDDPGAGGRHSWPSFEDFQNRVCRAEWYQPAGQMVVIDTATGDWAAMSAITRYKGTDYAYNLFTGVDRRYRGRKLGQAVKARALCYARDVLDVAIARTHHDSRNLPMIAIDRKMGYLQTLGNYWMEKNLA